MIAQSAAWASTGDCCKAGKNTIYAIADGKVWTDSQKAGAYKGERLEKAGFLDAMDTAWQIDHVANKHWKGKSGAMILCIDKSKVKPEIKMEKSSSGVYPHIYGPLNNDAVTAAVDFPAKSDGTFTVPAAINCTK